MNLEAIYQKSLNKEQLSSAEGELLINSSDNQLDQLLSYAKNLREKFCGDQSLLCGIINAKSGKCSENCCFCSQSAHHTSKIDVYPLMNKTDLVTASQKAKESGVHCFSIVTSGKGINSNKDFQTILETIPDIKTRNKCASLGILTKQQLQKLKDVGLSKFHHNLETAKSFFSNMCTTHTYEDRIQTIKNAKTVGLDVCVGGIFGLGESPEQRVELGLAIKELEPASIPINIVHAIEGTKTYEQQPKKIRWQDVLKLIATYRFIMPDKIIGVFGGRESNLGEHQSKIFDAGANSILIGNYLTTLGQEIEKDLQMVRDAGLHN